jgi:hypothetical protein
MSDSITREEQYLNAIANGESIDLKPITREEQFLAKAAGQNVKVPTPITRKEMFLSRISSSGGTSKPEQEKKVEITKNGATEIFPDDGFTLSRVVANVNVPTASGESKLAQVLDGSITELTEQDLQGATQIQSRALYQRNNLTRLHLPEGLTTIQNYACENCPKLTTVVLPKSLKNCDYSAFYNDGAISEVYYNGNISEWCRISFGQGGGNPIVFAGNLYLKNSSNEYELLENPIIPNNVSKIESYVFSGCKFTNVRIGNGITSINKTAFSSCDALTDIYIDKPENSVSGAPWGATNATIHWNTPLPSEEV